MMPCGCKLIILGPPGSGKGTQARVVAEALYVPHLDCGKVIRDAIAAGTEFGLKVKQLVTEGHLVPDELIIDLMLHRICTPDCDQGFMLDGFPRTIRQAEGLDDYLKSKGNALDAIIHLDLDEGTVVKRLSSRRYSPKCGRVFNLETAPPKVDMICDDCGDELVQRPDDHPGTIRERLSVYLHETAPLVEYYKNAKGYIDIDGAGEQGAVTQDILNAIRWVGIACDDLTT